MTTAVIIYALLILSVPIVLWGMQTDEMGRDHQTIQQLEQTVRHVNNRAFSLAQKVQSAGDFIDHMKRDFRERGAEGFRATVDMLPDPSDNVEPFRYMHAVESFGMGYVLADDRLDGSAMREAVSYSQLLFEKEEYAIFPGDRRRMAWRHGDWVFFKEGTDER
jgi:hypothetical protein